MSPIQGNKVEVYDKIQLKPIVTNFDFCHFFIFLLSLSESLACNNLCSMQWPSLIAKNGKKYLPINNHPNKKYLNIAFTNLEKI